MFGSHQAEAPKCRTHHLLARVFVDAADSAGRSTTLSTIARGNVRERQKRSLRVVARGFVSRQFMHQDWSVASVPLPDAQRSESMHTAHHFLCVRSRLIVSGPNGTPAVISDANSSITSMADAIDEASTQIGRSCFCLLLSLTRYYCLRLNC